MLLLGLDTATAVTTVALVRSASGGAVDVLGERSHLDPRRHGEVLPVQIDEVLREAGDHTGRAGRGRGGHRAGCLHRAPRRSGDGAGLGAGAADSGPRSQHARRAGVRHRPGQARSPLSPTRGVVSSSGRPMRVTMLARQPRWSAPRLPPVRRSTGLTVVGPPGTPPIEGLDVVAGDEPSGAALCRLVLCAARARSTTRCSRSALPATPRRDCVGLGPKSVLS